MTKTTYSLINKISVLETNVENLKSRLDDLELFKLRIYNNEIIPGRRAWDDIDIDIDEEDMVD